VIISARVVFEPLIGEKTESDQICIFDFSNGSIWSNDLLQRNETVSRDNQDALFDRCAYDTVSQFGMNSNAL